MYNWNYYALSIFSGYIILLVSSDNDKHMLMGQKMKKKFAYKEIQNLLKALCIP